VLSCLGLHTDRSPTSLRHFVFQPAGGKIAPGAVCPVCGWVYDRSETLKVRTWNFDSRVRSMMRNRIVIEVMYYIA
jgi:hypothetical protein